MIAAAPPEASASGGDPSALAALRDALLGVGAQACDMAHERVAADAGANPLVPGGIVRPALCPARRRRINLACSHGSARAILREALGRLAALEEPGAGADLAALGAIEAGLGPLDHRRYAAETRLAEARRDGRPDRQALAEVAASVARHRDLVAALAGIGARTLAGLDAALAREALAREALAREAASGPAVS